MAADAQDLQGFKDRLLSTDGEFRQLVQEHHDLDERINQFSRLAFLSEQQQFEESAPKKKKLALKDRIEGILRGRPGDAGVAGIPAPAH
jgi:uncharacterized protein YdcH (DUF465 family)